MGAGAEHQDGDMHPITRAEFTAAMKLHEVNLQLAIVKVQKWAMGSVLATLLGGGIGTVYAYTNLISYLESFKPIAQLAMKTERRMEEQAAWKNDQERHDMLQDQILIRLDNRYNPPERTPPPTP